MERIKILKKMAKLGMIYEIYGDVSRNSITVMAYRRSHPDSLRLESKNSYVFWPKKYAMEIQRAAD